MTTLSPELVESCEQLNPGFKEKWTKNLLRKEKDAEHKAQEDSQAKKYEEHKARKEAEVERIARVNKLVSDAKQENAKIGTLTM